MRKTTKRDNVNLFFSAFLVIGYVVCAYFFSTLIGANADAAVSAMINMAIFAVFGLILFYATRVGDGKQIKRFSIPTLILIDLPAIYIIVANLAVGLPFHTELSSNTAVVMLAAVALGYAIPYTFLSGFELAPEGNAEEENQAEEQAAEDGGYSTLDIAFESEDEAQNTDKAIADDNQEVTETVINEENSVPADETQEEAK